VPEAETVEERHELADAILRYTKVYAQYEGYNIDYRRVKQDFDFTPLPDAMSFDDWEERVRSAHKRLREAFGSDRVVLFVPLEQVPELQIIAKAKGEAESETKEDIPLFALIHGIDADFTERIVKELGLSPFHYFAVSGSVEGEEYLLTYIKGAMWDMHMDIWGEVVRDLRVRPVPSQVIDPSSKNPIYFDDYLKRHLPLLEEKYFQSLRKVVKEFEGSLEGRVGRASAKTLQKIFETDFGALDGSYLRQVQEELSGFADWVKEHPSAFKVWLSFLVPAGERNIATLAYYAFAKTALDYITLMTSEAAQEVGDATTLLSFLQKRFEHWADEGKKALGLEKVAVPTETLLKVVDKTLRRFWVMGYGWSSVDAPEVNVRMLTLPPVWSYLWIPQVRDAFKQVAEALVNEPLKKGFEKFPQDQKFYNAILSLINFQAALSSLGLKSIGERKATKRVDYDDETLKAFAKRAIGKFHNELSQVVKAVTKVKSNLKETGVERPKDTEYAAVVIGFSPTDFYSLTTDGTCFGGGNKHHPFALGMYPNSYTLRVFVGGKGKVCRAWGILSPDRKFMYVTNRYGDINEPTLMKISSVVASALFGVPTEDLEVKEGAKEEFSGLMARIASREGLLTVPYLNGDAFKVSVRK
jgi:hypothetical protein